MTQLATLLFQSQDRYRVSVDGRTYPATLRGRLRYQLQQDRTALVVGDRVQGELTDATFLIDALQPRTTFLVRDSNRFTDSQQGIAANLTHVVIVTSANHDFNLNRLRRFHGIAAASGAEPVVLISKTDLVDAATLATIAAQIEATLPGTPVLTINQAMDPQVALAPLLTPHSVLAFVGSSGVGKSTLLAKLLGLTLATRTIREDDSHGRHATTARQAFVLPSGTVVIDTPGMRAIGVESAGSGLEAQFAAVTALAAQCRFSDCRHQTEPGCAVQAALKAGTLDEATFAAFTQFQAAMTKAPTKADRTQAKAMSRMVKQAKRRKSLDRGLTGKSPRGGKGGRR
ncbi:ribosome small subunit-dependent GTPase A [Lacticaseibacillus kribbianus]|uniref:ribosome small subunit-dependent GTPase A n=1 Tax=Lacticaseibacillus kribbianus TaxID=2926292 RepID=UPI001CD2325B|nr:ribosome small subunit-dependent GTPase A [Lacticaseibacillus kribbianus]